MVGKKTNLVSIIIPAFRQDKTIVRDLRRIEKVLSQLRHDFEMIVVVDGIIDKTYEYAKRLESAHIKVVSYDKNRGKGFAIRYGFVRAKGDIVGFIDSGMDLNPNGLSMLLEHFEWYGADIIVGSKRHPVSKVNYPLDRKIISHLSQIFIRLLFGLNVRDTQVGMKFFKRKVLEKVLPRLLVKQYAFDIEILTVAHSLGFKRIYEAPIELNWNMGSGITNQKLWHILYRTLWDTLAIFYRLKILRYYHGGKKRRWKYDPELGLNVNVG